MQKNILQGYPLLDQSKDVQGKIFRYLGLSDEQEFYKTYQDFMDLKNHHIKVTAIRL